MNQKFWVGVAVVVAVLAILVVVGKKRQTSEVHETASAAQQLSDQASSLESSGQKLEAKALYQKILTDYSDFDKIETIQKQLADLNMEIIFSNAQTPQTVVHEVKEGDSLGKIAKQYHTTQELIKKSNNMTGDTVRLGQKLRVWTGVFNIFVDKSQNILILKCADEIIKVYNVSTGANNSTPVGAFKITSKLVDPVWFKSGAVIPPESPENVLGSRWMGFDLAGYGIHGTVEPDKIGQQVTAGCVRMTNKDVEEIFSVVPVGTQVTIVD